MLFDHGSNELVFGRIFTLELLKVLFDHEINDLVFVICVPLELPYLGQEIGYLLGLIILCLNNIHFLIEKLCCVDLLNYNSSSRVILVTCWTLSSQWCFIQRIDGIHLGNVGLLILPRLCPLKLLLILGRCPLLWFGGKEVSLPISYPGQHWK